MELEELREELKTFLEKKGWLDLDPKDIFIHLIEELGEIGKYLLFRSGYKKEEEGHKRPKIEDLTSEFIQAFSLFLHLSLSLGVDIEKAWTEEFNKIKKRFDVENR